MYFFHPPCEVCAALCTVYSPAPGTPLAAHTLQAAGVCPLHFLACGQQLTGVMSPLLTNIYICTGELDTAQLYSYTQPCSAPSRHKQRQCFPPGCSLDQVSDAAHKSFKRTFAKITRSFKAGWLVRIVFYCCPSLILIVLASQFNFTSTYHGLNVHLSL